MKSIFNISKIISVMLLAIIILCSSTIVYGALSDGLTVCMAFENNTYDSLGLHNNTYIFFNSYAPGITGGYALNFSLDSEENTIALKDYNNDFDCPTGNCTFQYWKFKKSPGEAFRRGAESQWGNFITDYHSGIYSSSGSSWDLYLDLRLATGQNADLNAWTLTTITINDTSICTYYNSTKAICQAKTVWKDEAENVTFRIGGTAGYGRYEGLMDDFKIFNRTLSATEISVMYNNPTNTSCQNLTYKAPAPPGATYNVNTTSTPDINTTTFRISVTSLVTVNNTGLENDSMKIFYGINTTLNYGCAIFYQNNCVSDGAYQSKDMTKISNTTFNSSFLDTDIFPGYYPFNYTIIDNSEHLNETVYRNNNVVFNISNMSTQASQYNIVLEVDAKNLTGVFDNLLIYYCNSTYNQKEPSGNSNCELVDSYAGNGLFHTHTKSQHYSIPVSINTVKKTTQSYIVFRSTTILAVNGWNFRYILNTSYNNQSFRLCDNSFNCFSTNHLFDIHIHPFNNVDFFKTYTVLNNSGVLTESNYIYDYYNLTPFAPSGVDIILPLCDIKKTISTTVNTTLFFNWTKSSSLPGLNFTYNLSIRNSLQKFIINSSIPQSENYFNATINGLLYPTGIYKTYVDTCDSLGYCDLGVQTCTFNLCTNTWSRSIQPCVSDVKLIDYYDSSYCDEVLDNKPVDNGLYESCVSSTNVNLVIGESLLIIIFLMVMIIISLILGVLYNTHLIGLATVLSGILLTVFIVYGYPAILYYATAIIMIVFIALWMFIGKNK